MLALIPSKTEEAYHEREEIATSYDFQGKAEGLALLCEQVGCNSAETVFVEDHFNDAAIIPNLAIACPCWGRDRWRRKS